MAADSVERDRGRLRIRTRTGEFGTSLARAADDFVARLRLPHPSTWDDLQSSVEKLYGKPIHLIASNSPALRVVTGLWIDTPRFGAVVCRGHDELHYQSQNAYHELAHILFVYAPDAWFNELLPDQGHTPSGRHGPVQCASDPENEDAQIEIAVEAVAFAMARRIQSLNRTSEEAYFG